MSNSGEPKRREVPSLPCSGQSSVEDVLANNDLLRSVFQHLSTCDLARTSVVSRSWNGMANCDDFWRRLDLEDLGRQVSVNQVAKLCQRHGGIQQLSLSGQYTDYSDGDLIQRVLPFLSRLRVLELSNGVMQDSVLRMIQENRLPELQRVFLDRVHFGSRNAIAAAPTAECILAHRGVTEFELSCCIMNRLSVSCAALEHLVLQDTKVNMMSLNVPALQSLTLTNCTKISDSALRATVTKLTTLTSLNLHKFASLTDDTLREFSEHLTSLTTLNVSACPALALNGISGGFCSLRTLDLSGCECLAASGVQTALESLPSLEEVCLDSCPQLTHLSISMPRLRRLSVSGCHALTSLEVSCSVLADLVLGSTQEFGRVQCNLLRHLYMFSNEVRQLQWRYFPSLETLELDCPNLEELSLSDCDSLKDSVFKMLSDRWQGGPRNAYQGEDRRKLARTGCPKLHTLRLEGCEGLKCAQLWHERLVTLSLSGCKGIRSLLLSCPVLQDLKLDDCCEMQQAVLKNSLVQHLFLGACCGLYSLDISSTVLASLDVRGCGGLEQLALACPALCDVDATFCKHLTESCLAEAMSTNPPVTRLVLSVCDQIGPLEFPFLLASMRSLDLSYTSVSDLSAVYEGCPQLTALNISSCSQLDSHSLLRILPSRGFKLPLLSELDISYCSLGTSDVASILLETSHLTSLALNGCDGVVHDFLSSLNLTSAPTAAAAAAAGAVNMDIAQATSAVAASAEPAQCRHDGSGSMASELVVRAAGSLDVLAVEEIECRLEQQPSNLRILSLVKCTNLTSVCLGLIPLPGPVRDVQERGNSDAGSVSCRGCGGGGGEVETDGLGIKLYAIKHYPFLSRQELDCDAVAMQWQEVPTLVSGLQTLRLGLSGVQAVALALPNLTQLELSSCVYLRMLELRCPLLLNLLMQACRMVPRQLISRVTCSCPMLETLDAQHVPVARALRREGGSAGGSPAAEKVLCTGIRNLLLCPQLCSLCSRCAPCTP